MKLFVVTLPPPMHGQAKVSQDTVNLFEEKIVININYTNKSLLNKLISYITLLRKFVQALVKYNISLIYFTPSRTLQGAIRDVPVLLLALVTKKKVIGHIHGADFHSFLLGINTFFRKIIVKLYSNCNYLIVPMKEIEETIHEEIGLNNIITIPNYINLENYYNKKVGNDQINLLFMSNILESKGIFDFLELVKSLKKEGLDVQAKVAGNFMKGAEKEKQAVQNCHEEKLITYLGFIKDEQKYFVLSECDFFVFPSHGEAFPLVLLEAMASGCVIISSNSEYHKYVVEESYGSVFDFDLPDQVLNYICDIKGNHQKMIAMKKAAMAKSKEFSFKRYKKTITSLINGS